MSGRSDAGFTLVEALVSLFVFSLVAAGSVIMLTQSVETQRRVGEAQAALAELQTARALLSADMLQLTRREAREPDGQVRPAFVGGDSDVALAFVRAAAEPNADGAMVTRQIFVEYVFRDGALLRRSRSALDATPDTEAIERQVLSRIDGGRFEFFDGTQWRQQWLAAGGGAPRAVALVVDTTRYGAIRIETLVGL